MGFGFAKMAEEAQRRNNLNGGKWSNRKEYLQKRKTYSKEIEDTKQKQSFNLKDEKRFKEWKRRKRSERLTGILSLLFYFAFTFLVIWYFGRTFLPI